MGGRGGVICGVLEFPYTPTPSSTGRKREKEGRGEDWLRQGMRRVSAVNEGVGDFVAGGGEEVGPRWLNRSDSDEMEVIGAEGTIAQVWA